MVDADSTASPTPRQTDNWFAVVLIAAGTFTMVTLEFLPIGLLQQIASQFGITIGTAGLMVTTPGIVAAIVSPALAVIASSAPRRNLILTLTVLMALSSLIMATAQAFLTALGSRVLLGITIGGMWAFSAATAQQFVRADHGSRAIAIVSAGISIGTVLGVPVGTTIGQHLGWQWSFGIAGILSVLVLTLQWWSLPSTDSLRRISWSDLIALASIPGAREALAIGGLLAAAHFMAYTFFAPMLQNVVGLSARAFSNTFAAYGMAGVAGVVAAERIASKRPEACTLVAAFLLGSLLLTLWVTRHSPQAAVLLVVLWGLVFGGIPVALQIWLQRAAPARFEAGSSILVSVFQVCLALGSVAGGQLTNHGGVSLAFLGGACVAFGSCAWMLIPRAARSLSIYPTAPQ